MATTGRKRTKAFRQHQITRFAQMWLQGATQDEIASEVGLSQSQVSRDIAVIMKQLARDDNDHLKALRNKELLRLDMVEKAYWTGWNNSLKPREIQSQEKTSGAGGADDQGVAAADRLKASLRTEERDGNGHFLDGVLKVVDRRCRLLGLDEPQKIDIGGRQIKFIEIVAAPPRTDLEAVDVANPLPSTELSSTPPPNTGESSTSAPCLPKPPDVLRGTPFHIKA